MRSCPNSEPAFAPNSMHVGALLPSDARDVIVRAHALPPGAVEAASAGWLAPNVPLLVRGQANILPLAWWGSPGRAYNPYAEPGDIATFASHVQGAALHRAGPWNAVDLSVDADDSDDGLASYRAALRASGATRANAWVYPDAVGVVLVWAGTETAGTRSLALHFVPADWVSARWPGDPVEGIDITWSWADVIELTSTGA